MTETARKGYSIDKDDDGLTARDREVRDLALEGKSGAEIGRIMGFSKQRGSELIRGLIHKGVLVKVDGKIVKPGGLD